MLIYSSNSSRDLLENREQEDTVTPPHSLLSCRYSVSLSPLFLSPYSDVFSSFENINNLRIGNLIALDDSFRDKNSISLSIHEIVSRTFRDRPESIGLPNIIEAY